jgi:hypothetical protein
LKRVDPDNRLVAAELERRWEAALSEVRAAEEATEDERLIAGGVFRSTSHDRTVGISLSHITGRPLLGEKVWRTGPVAIITYEDDQEESHRRIAAACEHHRV